MINVNNVTISEKYFVISWKRKILKQFQVQKLIPSFTVHNHPRSVVDIAMLPRGCACSFRRHCKPTCGGAQRCQPLPGDPELASCCQMLPYMIQRKNIFTLRLFGKAFNQYIQSLCVCQAQCRPAEGSYWLPLNVTHIHRLANVRLPSVRGSHLICAQNIWGLLFGRSGKGKGKGGLNLAPSAQQLLAGSLDTSLFNLSRPSKLSHVLAM